MAGTPSDLCLSCGMCCDGSIFDHALVTPDEAAALEGTKAIVSRTADGEQVLRIPCAALEGKCCTIYEQRPKTCRAFRCSLYLGVEDGTVRFEDARKRVSEALLLTKEAGLNSADGPVLKQAMKADWRGDQPRREAVGKLAELLALHFLPDDYE